MCPHQQSTLYCLYSLPLRFFLNNGSTHLRSPGNLPLPSLTYLSLFLCLICGKIPFHHQTHSRPKKCTWSTDIKSVELYLYLVHSLLGEEGTFLSGLHIVLLNTPHSSWLSIVHQTPRGHYGFGSLSLMMLRKTSFSLSLFLLVWRTNVIGNQTKLGCHLKSDCVPWISDLRFLCLSQLTTKMRKQYKSSVFGHFFFWWDLNGTI